MKSGFVVFLAVVAVLLGPGPGLSHSAEKQAGTDGMVAQLPVPAFAGGCFRLAQDFSESANHLTKAAGDAPGYVRPSDKELRKTLSPLQYKVTRENGTEPAFKNEYWNNDKDGIYVDIVSGEPLFSSLDKFRSGTGWPSFTKPLEPDNISEKKIRKLFFIRRTEVRSQIGDSHLGYLFKDDSSPTGTRYSINSAALRFIPKEDLQKEGYGMYSHLFSCDKRKAAC
ncbi:MAG: peptide-methionine (R)-S-oxide reductase MsrB [Syntrophobacteraceae bacterium]